MKHRRYRGSRLVAALSDRMRQIDWSRLDQHLSRFAHRLWQWLLRFVFRASRAFLAGAGALTLLVLGSLRLAGIERVSISGVLYLLLVGGGIGVAIQRFYKRIALLRRISEALRAKIEAIEDIQ